MIILMQSESVGSYGYCGSLTLAAHVGTPISATDLSLLTIYHQVINKCMLYTQKNLEFHSQRSIIISQCLIRLPQGHLVCA